MYTEDELIQISALQSAYFCERQYALIHLEQTWEDNRYTAEGRLLHERVDVEHHESRRLFKQEYGMAIRSLKWGLIGKCDLVEIWYDKTGKILRASPVEFKRGRKKMDDTDRVQLCAQVLCLEDMFGKNINSAQFYYLQEHRRSSEIIDEQLRKKTVALINQIMLIRETGKTALAKYLKRKCDNCSMIDLCMPKSMGTEHKNVKCFIKSQLNLLEEADEETS